MKDSQVAQTILRLSNDWSPDAISDVQYLEGGYSNLNFAFTYACEKYVVRIPERAQPYVDRKFENEWYRRLPEHFVKPVFFEQETGCMISPWVAGVLLVDALDAVSLDALSRYLHQLHAELPVCARTYNVATLLQAYDPSLARLSAGALKPLDHTRPCHNDLNPWNIIVTATGWTTLDWEYAGNNDPLFDLVALHQGLQLPSAQLDELAQLYLADLYSDDDTPARLRDALRAFWLREAGWARFQIDSGNDRQEVHDQLRHAQSELRSF